MLAIADWRSQPPDSAAYENDGWPLVWSTVSLKTALSEDPSRLGALSRLATLTGGKFLTSFF
jgi:hypothetical protein